MQFFIKNILKQLFITLWPYILIILIWQAVIIIFHFPGFLLPSFFNTLKALIEHWPLLLHHSLVTTFEAITGLSLAIAASIVLGGIISYFPLIEKALYPLILLWQIIPLMAIAPLVLIWVGFGINAKILLVFLSCLFPCLVAFVSGLKNVDSELLEFLTSMRASKLQVLRIVKFPSSIHALFAGIKISVTYSLTSAVVGEYLGASSGLGIYMARQLAGFDTPALFAAVFCVVVITLILYRIVVIIEKLSMPWKRP